MHRSRAFKYLVGAAVLAAALILSLATAEPQPAADPNGITSTAARYVETAAVSTADAPTTLRFAGNVRSVRRAELAFSVGGRLLTRPVEVGDRVVAGAVLARLEGDELGHAAEAAVAAHAEAATRAAQALRDRDRVRRLVAAKAATAEELEQVEAAAEAAAAVEASASVRLREARRLRGETVLAAPWAGTVTEVSAEPGEWVKAGAPLVGLTGDGELEVEVRVPESLLADLGVGQQVGVELPFGGPRLDGRVTSVGRAAVGSGRLFPLLVALPGADGLVPGVTAEVLVQRAPRGESSVPLAAVINPGGAQPAVFVVDGGRARRVAVEVVELRGERVAVRGVADGRGDGGGDGNLAPGDAVITAGLSGLIDGDPVTVGNGAAAANVAEAVR